MARVLVLYASQDKQFVESFIQAAKSHGVNLAFDDREKMEALALDADTPAQYSMLIALLSPEALDPPSLLQLFEGFASLSGRLLIAAMIRQVSLPSDLHGWRYVNAEYLSPQQLASTLFAPASAPTGDTTSAGQVPEPPAPISPGDTGAGIPIPPALSEESSPSPAPYPDQPPPAPGAVPQPAPQPSPRQDAVSGAASNRQREPRRGRAQTLQFSAYHPTVTPVETWQTLLVYTHLPAQLGHIQHDAGTFTELGSAPVVAQGQSLRKIARNVEITIEPHVEGITFSPAQDSFIWRGEWHRSLFRYFAARETAGSVRRGWIDIYAERVSPICTIEISLACHPGTPATSLSAPQGIAVTSNAFDTVFISYSHRDREAMRQAREGYLKLGIAAYHDDLLEAGDNFEQRLAGMIRAANVFHLLWSDAAARSHEVRKEWLLALASERGERFIRPWYWQQPLVPPPPELAARKISFRYEHLRRRLLSPSTWL